MTTQHNEIASLKKRVKKLERKNKSRTHRLKRLYKVGLTDKVESSGDEESLGEDASKQGMIDVIDADEEIILVSVQDEVVSNDADKEMFDVDVLDGEVFVAEQEAAVKGVNDEVNSSGSTENVIDEAVHKEWGDRLVRAAITVFSLEAERDSAKVDSSKDEQSLGEDASKQRWKINDIDADEDITLVNDQDNAKMFDVNDLHGEEVFVEKEVADKEVSVAGEVNAACIATTDKGKAIMIEEHVKPKKKKQIRLDEEVALKLQAELQAEFDEEQRLAREKAQKELEANTALIKTWDDVLAKINVDYQMAERLKFFAAKRAEDKRNKPPTQAQQRKIMCTYLKNVKGKKLKDLKNKSFDSIQKMFDRAFKRVNTFIDFRTELVKGSLKKAGEELIQECIKKQKVGDDKETTKLKQLMEIIPDEEEVAIDAIPLAVKFLRIIDWKIYKEGKKSYYQIVRADGKSQMYMFFRQMLKRFDRDDLEDLYKLVKARYRSTRPVEDLNLLL
uniref:Uncharacterized protein n=1 Tax=Tanacetum cinerariifolium TaxID=118510 RepID=A0A6L2LTU8_TANCI|nr:hypothetical protein [Tanacetum cinerariifolium]